MHDVMYSNVMVKQLTSWGESWRSVNKEKTVIRGGKTYIFQALPKYRSCERRYNVRSSCQPKSWVHTSRYKKVDMDHDCFCDINIIKINPILFWSHCIPICIRTNVQIRLFVDFIDVKDPYLLVKYHHYTPISKLHSMFNVDILTEVIN